MSGMKQEAIRKSESNYAAELTALRAQVADLRAASDDLSHALMRDWNRSTKESSERVVATWKRLTEVLAATQLQEVQP